MKIFFATPFVLAIITLNNPRSARAIYRRIQNKSPTREPGCTLCKELFRAGLARQ